MFVGGGGHRSCSINPIPPYSSFQQISFYNIIHFFGHILNFYCLKTSQSYFQMVYSLIRILTCSPTWHISKINCWKKTKLTVTTFYAYKTTFRSIIYSFLLINTCCKNLLYPLFSLFPHQNKTLQSFIYIHFSWPFIICRHTYSYIINYFN